MQSWLRAMRNRNVKRAGKRRLNASEIEKARQQKHAKPKPLEPWLAELLGRVTQNEQIPHDDSE